MEFEVFVSSRAGRQMDRAINWWRTNRLENPDLLRAALDAAIANLETMPNRAVGAPPSRHPQRRKLVTRQTGYVIVYRVRPRLRRVEVVSVRDGRRG